MKSTEIQSALSSIADGFEKLAELFRDESSPSAPITGGPYVGLAEATKILHCSRPTVRRYVESGLIDAIKLGKRDKYSVPSMQKFNQIINR